MNGAYMGVIDGFEKFVDVGDEAQIFAEALPEGDFLPANFFINAAFFQKPPDCADVYLCDGDAVVYLTRYAKKNDKMKVAAQTRFCGQLVTLFISGGSVYVCCDGEQGRMYELSRGFENATLTESAIGGRPVLLIEGEGCLAVLGESGERVFYNAAKSWSCGEHLDICVGFATCAGCVADCTFAYDGHTMTLIKSRTRKTRTVDGAVAHFAFFESVMTRADCTEYLSDELKGRAGELNSYLGEFADVLVPPSKFYEKHGDIKAAGLVYPVLYNLFKVRYFAVEMKDGKIDNLYEVE